jgi:hypothetical protein
VDDYKENKMMLWREKSGRVNVIKGGKYDIKIKK